MSTHDIFANIRYSLRQFRLSPVFTAAAVLTLALGIGGTTAIFSLMHAVMLHSLPVADPASLYRVGDGNDCCVEGGPQDKWGMYSFPLYERIKAEIPEFEDITAFQSTTWTFGMRREAKDRVARPLSGEYVSGSYFSTLGIRPFAGRLFLPSDDRPGAPPVAAISYHVWRGAYGGDPAIVGSICYVEGHPFTIIGVTPPGFFGETLRGDPPDLWLPLQQEPMINASSSLLKQPVSAWLRVIGRLRPGATTASLSPRLTALLRRWMENDSGYPAAWMPEIKRLLPRQSIAVVPAGAGVAVMKEEYGRSLEILLAVCSLVLLIACANVANLLLARGVARRHQTSVRLAIGATRRQIVGQALIESLLLSVGGGVAGLVVAVGAARLLLALAFHGAEFLPINTTPSVPVLAFAFALSVITGVIFGAAPAWFATRTDPVEALHSTTRATRDSSSAARQALLIVQATLSVVLVAGAALLTRSLANLEHQDFGYQTTDRVMVSLNPPPLTYTPAQLNALYRNLLDHVDHLPGVERSGLALYNPLTDNWGELIVVEGRPIPKFHEQSGASWDRVSSSYLEVIGEPVLRGRGFTDADNENTAPVALVNEAFVNRFLPNEDPLEKHFGLDMPEYAGMFRIIGVVRNAKFASWGLSRPARPMFFVPLAQYAHYNDPLMQKLELRSHFISGIMLLTSSGAGVIESLVRKTLADVDPNLTVTGVRSMQEQVNRIFDQQRSVASLAGLFGLVALILAAVGLYGVTAYSVAQRTGEIGIRMALGASRGSVIQLVLRGAFRRVAWGLLLGIPLAIGAGKLISAELYGVRIWDPLALSVALASLTAAAFLAAFIPATRAASIAPMDALRTE